MDLSKLLIPGAVRVLGQLTSKKRLFQELGEVTFQAYGLSSAIVVDGLQERESLGPTGVGNGIALPHARLEEIEKIFGVFIRLEKPLDYESVDRQPVDLVFGLFAPKDSGVEHLKALAQVSRTMRDPGICAKLRANTDPDKLYAILTEARTPQVAA
ncbi:MULTISPECIES: PTS sugar transporter subunit IIA [Cypionkella]|jgi:PTS system nitrogen regulatory IIA component|uniref:PTS sugar transporter subunit IIA n=1 Tax=Cypionkella TaxID=2804673 RepID=UPI0006B4AF30|nr:MULTISPECIES: PTS sugar transporter subunit IIA [Cypionkella]MDO8982444.1 PTS sugar transporter subunit IIA [Cypionkella sp.]MDP2050447.1 PTS sugar transporter subunit IIA [Cypionkella sp.]MDZ4310458.1 PTS sugar transporter subunit IIA [Cypionkella sp.]